MVHHFTKAERAKMHTHDKLHIQFYRPYKLAYLTRMLQSHPEEFPPGWAKSLVYRIRSGEDLGFSSVGFPAS